MSLNAFSGKNPALTPNLPESSSIADLSYLTAFTERHIRTSIAVKEALTGTCCEILPKMAKAVALAFCRKGRLYLFGNGGSAADAQHIAAEFVNRLQRERGPLPALALTVDTSILTAISNDYRFEDVFSKQLAAFGQPGDVVLGISTSGRSGNVIHALKWARENGLETLGFAGDVKTNMDDLCDTILHVPSNVTQFIQESHIMAGHILCALVDEILLGPAE
jgi:D-sedoheptulose 7-phosphate isomerase